MDRSKQDGVANPVAPADRLGRALLGALTIARKLKTGADTHLAVVHLERLGDLAVLLTKAGMVGESNEALDELRSAAGTDYPVSRFVSAVAVARADAGDSQGALELTGEFTGAARALILLRTAVSLKKQARTSEANERLMEAEGMLAIVGTTEAPEIEKALIVAWIDMDDPELLRKAVDLREKYGAGSNFGDLIFATIARSWAKSGRVDEAEQLGFRSAESAHSSIVALDIVRALLRANRVEEAERKAVQLEFASRSPFRTIHAIQACSAVAAFHFRHNGNPRAVLARARGAAYAAAGEPRNIAFRELACAYVSVHNFEEAETIEDRIGGARKDIHKAYVRAAMFREKLSQSNKQAAVADLSMACRLINSSSDMRERRHLMRSIGRALNGDAVQAEDFLSGLRPSDQVDVLIGLAEEILGFDG